MWTHSSRHFFNGLFKAHIKAPVLWLLFSFSMFQTSLWPSESISLNPSFLIDFFPDSHLSSSNLNLQIYWKYNLLSVKIRPIEQYKRPHAAHSGQATADDIRPYVAVCKRQCDPDFRDKPAAAQLRLEQEAFHVQFALFMKLYCNWLYVSAEYCLMHHANILMLHLYWDKWLQPEISDGICRGQYSRTHCCAS